MDSLKTQWEIVKKKKTFKVQNKTTLLSSSWLEGGDSLVALKL